MLSQIIIGVVVLVLGQLFYRYHKEIVRYALQQLNPQQRVMTAAFGFVVMAFLGYLAHDLLANRRNDAQLKSAAIEIDDLKNMNKELQKENDLYFRKFVKGEDIAGLKGSLHYTPIAQYCRECGYDMSSKKDSVQCMNIWQQRQAFVHSVRRLQGLAAF